MIINFQRIVQPSVTQNARNISYPISSFTRNEAKTLLAEKLAGGGLFGIEAHRTNSKRHLHFSFHLTIRHIGQKVSEKMCLNQLEKI